MKLLSNSNISLVWLEYMSTIIENGYWEEDDRESVFESSPIMFKIETFNDTNNILKRNANPHIIDIYTKKMFSMELIEELNSTYGDRIFGNLGINQFQWAIDRLKFNRVAKSCFIPLVVPNDPGPRIPCLSALQFSIRKEKINIHATFRSQNAFNAYGNFFGLKALLEKFSEAISVPPGKIYFFVNFPHIYKSNHKEAKKIVEKEFEGIH